MAGPKRKTMITIIATALMMMGYGLAEKAAAQEESSSRSTVSMAVEIQISTHVGRIQEVTGRVRAKGEPVLLVRADLPNEPWWVQGKPTPTAKDRFKAKAIFGNFLMLGVTEQMDRSVQLLAAKLAPYGLDLKGKVPHKNTTRVSDQEKIDLREDPKFRKYAGRFMDVEQEFYDWALERFERDAAAHGL